MQVTDDGGKTWRRAGEKSKHVDNHALWIDPENTDHLLNGNDGGIYETWDRAATWQFTANLPVTQFYRVAVDDAKPFYNVYGGTQDNFTPRRPVAHRQRPRHPERRLVRHAGGRRLLRGRRPEEPQHRLLRVAARRPRPLRPEDRRAGRHPAPGRAGRGAAALELGLAADRLARTRRRGSTSPRRGSSGATTAANSWTAVSPRPDAPDRPEPAAGDGARLERRRRRQERLDVVLREHRLPGREPEEGGARLRRHRRRPRPGDRGRRRGLAEGRHVPGRARDDLRRRPRSRRRTRRTSSTRRSTTTSAATSSRTS